MVSLLSDLLQIAFLPSYPDDEEFQVASADTYECMCIVEMHGNGIAGTHGGRLVINLGGTLTRNYVKKFLDTRVLVPTQLTGGGKQQVVHVRPVGEENIRPQHPPI